MRKKTLILTAGLLIFLCAQGAFAAFLEFTGNYNGPTDLTNRAINISQFDSTLGTLLSANFQLSSTMTTSAFATNDGDFYAGWDKTVYSFQLVGSGSYSDIAISDSNPATRIVGSGIDTFNISNSLRIIGDPNWNQVGPTLTKSDSFSRSAIGDFIGLGDLAFFLTTTNIDTLYAAGLQSSGFPSPAPVGVSTNINSLVKVTYEYTPVPIPGAIWLLGSGLAGFFALKRKSKK